jgi:hypothetical protein
MVQVTQNKREQQRIFYREDGGCRILVGNHLRNYAVHNPDNCNLWNILDNFVLNYVPQAVGCGTEMNPKKINYVIRHINVKLLKY